MRLMYKNITNTFNNVLLNWEMKKAYARSARPYAKMVKLVWYIIAMAYVYRMSEPVHNWKM